MSAPWPSVDWPASYTQKAEIRALEDCAALQGAGPYAVLVLNLLWQITDAYGAPGFISQADLARRGQISERTVRDAIKVLAARQLVRRVVPPPHRRKREATTYYLPTPPRALYERSAARRAGADVGPPARTPPVSRKAQSNGGDHRHTVPPLEKKVTGERARAREDRQEAPPPFRLEPPPDPPVVPKLAPVAPPAALAAVVGRICAGIADRDAGQLPLPSVAAPSRPPPPPVAARPVRPDDPKPLAIDVSADAPLWRRYGMRDRGPVEWMDDAPVLEYGPAEDPALEADPVDSADSARRPRPSGPSGLHPGPTPVRPGAQGAGAAPHVAGAHPRTRAP